MNVLSYVDKHVASLGVLCFRNGHEIEGLHLRVDLAQKNKEVSRSANITCCLLSNKTTCLNFLPQDSSEVCSSVCPEDVHYSMVASGVSCI